MGKSSKKPDFPQGLEPRHHIEAGATASHPDGRTLELRMSSSGPVPPPALVREYNQIEPNLGTRLVEQGLKQSDHRMKLEQTAIRSNNWRSWAGLVIGGVVAIFGLERGFEAAMAGNTVFATLLTTVDLGALVTVFVIGRGQQAKERERKSGIMASTVARMLKSESNNASMGDSEEDGEVKE